MLQCEIAGLILNINSDRPTMTNRLQEYLVDQKSACDLKISIGARNSIVPPPGKLFSDEQITWVRKGLEHSGYFIYAKADEELIALADIDAQWKNGIISYLDNDNRSADNDHSESTELFTHLFIGVIFRYCLLHHGGLVIHASTIKWKGKGILFSAPSGTGKSTHVRLWQDLLGQEIKVLNDDTPAVRLNSGEPCVFGTPWSGSSHINCNDSASLAAIVLLEQAPVNVIRQMSAGEAVSQLMPRIFLPYFDQQLMKIALNIIDELIAAVPIYLLKCRPDMEAVELVMSCVK